MLPIDYDGIITEYNIKGCECGNVELLKSEELTVGKIYIEGNISGKSYFEIPAINLIKSCEFYSPEFILMYLPNENKYATWDSDHWTLFTFESVTWNHIKNNPFDYLNSQWSLELGCMKKFEPVAYQQINGWPF